MHITTKIIIKTDASSEASVLIELCLNRLEFDIGYVKLKKTVGEIRNGLGQAEK